MLTSINGVRGWARRSVEIRLAGAPVTLREPTISQVGEILDIAAAIPTPLWGRFTEVGGATAVINHPQGFATLARILGVLIPDRGPYSPEFLRDCCAFDEIESIKGCVAMMALPEVDDPGGDGDAADKSDEDQPNVDFPELIAFLSERRGWSYEEFCDRVTWRQFPLYARASGKMLRDILSLIPTGAPSVPSGSAKVVDGKPMDPGAFIRAMAATGLAGDPPRRRKSPAPS